MAQPNQKRETETTEYSDKIEGTSKNYRQPVRFDITDGYLGITQFEEGGKTSNDRVLLSPNQVEEMISFYKKRSPFSMS